MKKGKEEERKIGRKENRMKGKKEEWKIGRKENRKNGKQEEKFKCIFLNFGICKN